MHSWRGWNWILQIWTYRMLTGTILPTAFSHVIFTTLERLLEMAFDIYISTPSLCNQMKHVSKIVVLVRFVMIYCWCKVWTYDLCGHSIAQNCKLDILSRTQWIFKGFFKPTPFTFLNYLADFFQGGRRGDDQESFYWTKCRATRVGLGESPVCFTCLSYL